MDDEEPVIHEDPFAVRRALDAERPEAGALQLLFDRAGDGAVLPRGESRA